jgi:hypothetical protein
MYMLRLGQIRIQIAYARFRVLRFAQHEGKGGEGVGGGIPRGCSSPAKGPAKTVVNGAAAHHSKGGERPREREQEREGAGEGNATD